MVRAEVEKRVGDRGRTKPLLVGLGLYLEDRGALSFFVVQQWDFADRYCLVGQRGDLFLFLRACWGLQRHFLWW